MTLSNCLGAQKWKHGKDNLKCGSSYPLPDGTATECNPDGLFPCCSNKYQGECGYTALACSCEDCVDYRDLEKWRREGISVFCFFNPCKFR